MKFKNKPYTFSILFVLTGLIALATLSNLLYFAYGFLFQPNESSILLFLSIPVLLFFIVQAGVYLLLGWLLQRWAVKGSIVAIILSVFYNIISFFIILSFIRQLIDFSFDANTPLGLIALIAVLFVPLVLGVVAYYDIRYRVPMLISHSLLQRK
jgi:hypothetical protein